MFMKEFGRYLVEGDPMVYSMLFLATFAIVVIYERVQALFFQYSIKADTFLAQVRTLVVANKVEEAIALCTAQPTALLPKVVRMTLERSDRDDQSIKQAYDLACNEVIPLITRRLGYLAMVANVATLVGLLGTIHGLIQSFEAVSFADPAQKQTLLAQGISTSMNLTMMGLVVAIPVMVIYSFLQARQNKILEEIITAGTQVFDLLISRNYQSFDEDVAYPTGSGSSTHHAPPPPKRKVG